MDSVKQKKINARLIELVEAELASYDTEICYDNFIDEIYGMEFEKLGAPFSSMQPSEVLKRVDPVAYRCGHVDWLDAEFTAGRYEEIAGEVYDAAEVEKLREQAEEEFAMLEDDGEAATGN